MPSLELTCLRTRTDKVLKTLISLVIVISMGALRPEHVLRILELTDTFGIHTEAVTIPLATEETGSIKILPGGHLRIACPNNVALEEWLSDLRARLEEMDLSKVARH